jgi:hypothetical protein
MLAFRVGDPGSNPGRGNPSSIWALLDSAEAKRVLEKVKSVEGVQYARMDFVDQRFEMYDLFERKVEKQQTWA